MQETPDLLPNRAEVLFMQAVEVRHVQEVDDEDSGDDLANDGSGPEEVVLDDLGDGLADYNYAFAEDDEGEEGHALNHVCTCIAKVSE